MSVSLFYLHLAPHAEREDLLAVVLMSDSANRVNDMVATLIPGVDAVSAPFADSGVCTYEVELAQYCEIFETAAVVQRHLPCNSKIQTIFKFFKTIVYPI